MIKHTMRTIGRERGDTVGISTGLNKTNGSAEQNDKEINLFPTWVSRVKRASWKNKKCWINAAWLRDALNSLSRSFSDQTPHQLQRFYDQGLSKMENRCQ